MYPSIAALWYLAALIKFMSAIEDGGFLLWISAALFLVLAVYFTVVAFQGREAPIESINAPSS